MVGLGIVTYNRPDYFRQCVDAVMERLVDVVDVIYIYNDGSDEKYIDAYNEIIEPIKDKVVYNHPELNRGVAAAKNWCLEMMMEAGCDYLFLLEDDIIIKSPDAINMYIAASLDTGIHHFMFAHHGDGNKGGLRGRLKTAEFYTNCIGAYTMYTRRAIEDCGYFDEEFKNAIEHIEHTNRIADKGYHPPLSWGYADVVLSNNWLEEIWGSIDGSSIRPRADWMDNIIAGLEYWKQKDPTRFPFDLWLADLKKEKEVGTHDKHTPAE